MKKIILIGKMNTVSKDLHTLLADDYQVQLCSETLDVVEGMIKIVQPDLALVSLSGEPVRISAILDYLLRSCAELPVVTIGTEEEKSQFSSVCQANRFMNLTRPIDNAQILNAIRQRLGGASNFSAAAQSEAPEKERAKVLVVDDNAALLRNVKSLLEDTYEVMIVNSGVKAMAAIGKKRPDVILLDYEMPVCDGRQTLEMIRSDEETADIPVIFLTGVSDREHIEAVLNLKPAGYLLKPPTSIKLRSAIEQALS